VRYAIAIALLAACGKHDATPTQAAAAAATKPIDAKPAPPPMIDARDPAVVAADAHAFLGRWLDAQNNGDFAGYEALYDPHVSGVRRSGAQTARFDHDGWMRDRQRMFAHAMTVAAEDEHAAELHDRVVVTFTQTFEQGSYHDAGKKLLVLARRAGGLAIVHEEMMDSTISAPSRARVVGFAFGLGDARDASSMQLAIVQEGALLLARTDDDVGDDGAAYEQSSTDHTTQSERLSVTRAIDHAPPELAAAIGLEVQLLDEHLAPVCTATIAAIDHGRAVGIDASADDVWKTGTHVVVARLDAPGACRASAAFARPAALPALPAPDVRPYDVRVVGADDCVLDQASQTTVKRAGGFRGEVDSELTAVAAIDVDGDGAPDLVTTTGVFRASQRGAYDDWWPTIRWDHPETAACRWNDDYE
jgi:hypothetical protein